LNLYSKSNLLAEYRLNSAFGGLDAGYNFDRFSEIRGGYQAGYSSANQRIGSPLLPSVSGRTGSTRLRFAMDRLDNPIIPRGGVALLTTAEWIDANPGSQDSFPSAEITVMGFRRVSKPGSVYGIASGGSTFGSDQTGIPQFSLGGPGRLAAYGLNEFLVNQYAYGRAGYLHQIGALPAFLGGGVYLNTHIEIAKPYSPVNASGLAGDAVFGVATETLFGPLMIGGSIGDSGHRKWFFQLGKLF
jgi:NTE family protein